MCAALIDSVAAVLGETPPKRLGVAVSGGGDSVALLAVLVAYAKDHEIELHVVSVDHGVRPEAKQEISFVTDLCARWDLPHHVEYWTGWNGQGNFQANARDARYALMADWAYANDIGHIALGHTADDQAETFVMRLARGAGVDGLSAMAPRRVTHGITWIRPFLHVERAALRTYLQAARISWCEDPSNENRDYERIKVRDALTVLGTLGITIDGLVQVSHHMTKAREALDWQTFLAARDVATIQHGVVALDKRRFFTNPDEITRRLLVHSVTWVSGSGYAPRGAAVTRALTAVRAGQTTTLDGCQIEVDGPAVWVFREHNAVRDTVCEVGETWDDRWLIDGPEDDPDLEVRALGFEALAHIDGWRDIGLPRAALAASPSVWYDATLVAAPIAQPDEDWAAHLDGGADAYFAALLSH
ncbi:tRNA lysidine(34) synthetase TilS [uncultured Tateyamaria sp.]|uniref:tRNA lysidine(34) synthetase TilS n=1 Tax=uncultured Tateyamaria sp. TaxID=455651 RepID=UPI002609525E|nr:tRNA lysidine(34) synthetase TilS [uncultured Tateyamaria sp.]